MAFLSIDRRRYLVGLLVAMLLPVQGSISAPVQLVSPQAQLTAADFTRLLALAREVDEAYRRGLRVSGYLIRQSPGGNSPNDLRHLYFTVREDATTGRQIVAIRGTINSLDARIDLIRRATPDPVSGAIVHEGFARLAQVLHKPLVKRLNMDAPIIITGHSLGGAVAALLGQRLLMEGYPVERVITFGQPRFTNHAGAAIFGGLPLLRVVHQRDPIPLVPARMSGNLAASRGEDATYAHFNDALMLLDGPYYTVQPAGFGDNASLLRRLLHGIPQDHSLDAYIASLREKAQQIRFVPWRQHRRRLSAPVEESAPRGRKHDVRTNFNSSHPASTPRK